jgi:hypothetical protein
VTRFIVEHRLRRVAPGDLEALHEALQEITRRLAGSIEDGGSITYVRSTAVPESGRCICVFDATSIALVRRANELAQLPNATIVEAIDYVGGADGDAPDG